MRGALIQENLSLQRFLVITCRLMKQQANAELLDFVHNPEIDQVSKYYLAMTDLEKEKSEEAVFFWSFLRTSGLRVHHQFFEDFNFHDGFQIVNEQGQLVYFSSNISLKLRHDLDTVVRTPFDELFERDPFMSKRIMDGFIQLLTGPKTQSYDLSSVPRHVVRQKGFPDHDYTVQFIKAYPVHRKDGHFYGFVLRLNVQEGSSLGH
jgi:hypothetical protein